MWLIIQIVCPYVVLSLQMFSFTVLGLPCFFPRAFCIIVVVLDAVRAYVEKRTARWTHNQLFGGGVHTHMCMSSFDLCLFRYMFAFSVHHMHKNVGWLCLLVMHVCCFQRVRLFARLCEARLHQHSFGIVPTIIQSGAHPERRAHLTINEEMHKSILCCNANEKISC